MRINQPNDVCEDEQVINETVDQLSLAIKQVNEGTVGYDGLMAYANDIKRIVETHDKIIELRQEILKIKEGVTERLAKDFQSLKVLDRALLLFDDINKKD